MSIQSEREEYERELRVWQRWLEEATDEGYRQYCRAAIASIKKSMRELEEADHASAN